MIKHIPFQYDKCSCRDCIKGRERKKPTTEKEQIAEFKLGPNWKNIISGRGDQ